MLLVFTLVKLEQFLQHFYPTFKRVYLNTGCQAQEQDL